MPIFENATTRTNLSSSGMNWSATWGDIDSDGLPDIWISHHNPHGFVPTEYDMSVFQLKNGKFTEVTTSLPRVLKDYHGTTWGDFDNDGDKDVAQTTGGGRVGGITLFRNDSTATTVAFTDVSAAVGLAETSNAPGRNSAWLDYDSDGLLDIYLGATRISTGGINGRPSTIYKQETPGNFVDANSVTGLSQDGLSPYLADVTGDGSPELIVTSYGRIVAIYKTQDNGTPILPWQDIKGTWLKDLTIPKFEDLAIADFNNDLRSDIFISRRGFDDEVIPSGPNSLRSYIAAVPPGEEYGFTFNTAGNPTFTFSRRDESIDYDMIRVGASGRNPITNLNNTTFQLSPTADAGIIDHNQTTPGVYIGFQNGAWHYEVVGTAKASRGVTVTSTAPITNLQTQGFPLRSVPEDSQLLINTGTHFEDRSVASGIAAMTIAGQYATTGDFDNDGRVDIYVDQTGPAGNRGNVVLRNTGNAVFVNTGSNGAAGPIPAGLGGPVAAADYDQDGFLDILSTNGAGEPPFISLNEDGPLRLFHNRSEANGNGNNWLQVVLHGTDSNADGLGAKVIAVSGFLRQMREALNGQHSAGQDSSVLHFGLAGRTKVDTLEVRWPSGNVDRLTNVPVNQIREITEGEAPAAPGQQSSLDDTMDPSSTADDVATLGTAALAVDEDGGSAAPVDDISMLMLMQAAAEPSETTPTAIDGPSPDGLVDALSWADAPAFVEGYENVAAGGGDSLLV